jgi:DNA polymerase-3 subunit epsilon
LVAENRISGADAIAARVVARPRPNPLPPRISPQELAAHKAFVEKLGDEAIWAQYADPISTAAE